MLHCKGPTRQDPIFLRYMRGSCTGDEPLVSASPCYTANLPALVCHVPCHNSWPLESGDLLHIALNIGATVQFSNDNEASFHDLSDRQLWEMGFAF